MPSPLVTVLLPTFNSARYLPEAIESILLQSCDDLDVVVLDGGSSDPTIDIAKAYAARDPRLRVEIFPGLHPTLRVDQFLPSIQSRFVAMQHSDDISYFDRLAEQVKAFAADPDLGACSALARHFWHDRAKRTTNDGSTVYQRPEQHEAIKAQLPFWWVMHCPTMMYDREKMVMAGLKFTNEYQFCNDYWQVVSNIGKLKYKNLQMELSAYRMHYEGDGARNRERLRQEEHLLKQNILHYFGFEATPREIEIHARLRIIPDGQIHVTGLQDYDETEAWLKKMLAQNDVKGTFEPKAFTGLIDMLAYFTRELKARHTAMQKG